MYIIKNSDCCMPKCLCNVDFSTELDKHDNHTVEIYIESTTAYIISIIGLKSEEKLGLDFPHTLHDNFKS